MSYFLRYPVRALACELSKSDHKIFLHLLLYHFNKCRGDYEKEFFLTDRDLSSLSGCSLRTIWLAKKKLSSTHLISFYVGLKNKTYYKILIDNHDSTSS